ncbi:MAG: class I SAM-dependent methyltransferase [Pseudomonadota bacterium]
MDYDKLEAEEQWPELVAALAAVPDAELDAPTLLRRGRVGWRCGRYEQSLADFQAAAARFPMADTHVALAKALISLDRFDEATAQIQAARTAAPEHFEALFLAGVDRFRRASTDSALRELTRAVRRHPGWAPSRIALWQVAQVAGRPDAASTRMPDFPQDPFERSHLEAMQWFGPAGRWVAYAPEVLAHAVDAIDAGDLIVECGVFHGRSIRCMAARSSLPIHGFDSFEGLPEDWGDYPAGSYSTDGIIPDVPEHVTLHRGWFENTLPGFAEAHAGRQLALLHVDCDLYSSTVTILESLAPMISDGTILVFDDLLGYPNYREDEFRALQEYLARTGQNWEPIAAALVGREAAIRIRRP